MFCPNCGVSHPDDARFCPNCGTQLNQQVAAATVAPVEAAPPAAAPQEAAPQTPFAQVEFEPAPKKKRKKKLGVTLGILGGMLAVLAALAVVFWPQISGLFGKKATPDDYFRQVENQALAQSADAISGYYGNLISGEANQNAAATGTMRLQLSPKLLQSMGANAGELDWLNDLEIDYEMVMDGELYMMNMMLSVGGADITDLSMIMDYARQEGYLALPSLNETYLHFASEASYPTGGVSFTPYQLQELLSDEALLNALPDQQTVNTLLRRYLQIIVSNTSGVKQESITLQVGGVEQDVTVLKYQLTQKGLLKIAKAVLKEAKDDEDLKKCINNMAGYLQAQGLVGYMDVYSAFQQGVDMLLEQLEDAQASSDVLLVLTDYVNAEGKIIGRKLEGQGQSVLDYATVTNGSAFATKFNLADMLVFQGEGTVSGEIREGNYTLSVEGVEYLNIFASYNEKKYAEGALDGRFRLTPTAALLDAMGLDQQTESLASAMNVGLELVVSATDNDGTFSFNLVGGSEVLAGLSMNLTLLPDRFVTLPGNTLDVSYADQWAQDLDLKKLIQAMRSSTIPTELVDALEAAAFPVEVPASALEILETVWNSYADEEKFPVFGGNMTENAVTEGPGAFDITDTDGLTYMLLVPSEQVANIDGAASMVHMMNANTFTCGVYHVKSDVKAFADAMKAAITGNQWMCGMPEKLLITVVGGEYVLVAFGVSDAMDPFQAKLVAAYPQAQQLYFEALG